MGKRIAIVLILIVLLVAVVAPGLIGMTIERSHPNLVVGIDENLKHANLTLERFEPGWFSSQALVTVAMDTGPDLQWHADFEHGPWLMPLGWLTVTGDLSHPDHGPIASLTARVTPDGRIIGKINLSWPEAPLLAIEADLTIDQGFDRLQLVTHKAQVQHADFEARALDVDLMLVGLRSGPRSARLNWSAPQARIASHTQTRPEGTLTLLADGQRLSIEMAVSGNRWQWGNEDWRDVALQFGISGMHQTTTLGLLKRIKQHLDADLEPQWLAQQIQAELFLALPTLLASQPVVSLEALHFLSNSGPGDARFRATLSAPPPAGFLADPGLLVEVLVISAQAEVPRLDAHRWIEQQIRSELGPDASPEVVALARDDQLARLRANRIVVVDADRWHMAADLADEVLTLNGQMMRLPDF
jgi:hypothetical protein